MSFTAEQLMRDRELARRDTVCISPAARLMDRIAQMKQADLDRFQNMELDESDLYNAMKNHQGYARACDDLIEIVRQGAVDA